MFLFHIHTKYISPMELSILDPTKCEQFVSMFQHMNKFTEFINIMFQEERMYIQCMDPGFVIIFEIVLPSSWFSVFTLKNGSITLGVNAAMLYKVLNAYDKLESIQLDSTDEVLNIHFIHRDEPNKNVFNKHFEIPLLDVQTELMEIPEIDHQAELTFPSNIFANLINQLRNFGDTMRVVCSEEKISLESNSIELGKMSVDVAIDDLQEFVIEEDKTMIVGFSLKYLHDITSYQKIAKNIFIGMSDNSPLKASYDLSDGGTMSFYLAPKIDDE
jgi:proliferating cell nuclear antigen